MATLKSKIEISSSDFFSQSLNLSSSATANATGDDRAFSVERIAEGVRASCVLTQVETVLVNMHGKTLTLSDPYGNVHTVTFSTAYANSINGTNGAGSITVTSSNLSLWNNKTIIIVDNYTTPRTLTITFDQNTATIVRGTCTATAIAYTVGVSGLTSLEGIRNKLYDALIAINRIGDFSVTPTKSSNTTILDLTQVFVGNIATPTITGTAEGVTTTHVDFTAGGDGYTSSFAGISNNEATTTAHLKSLRNSLLLAYSEGLLSIIPGAVPTAATLTLSVVGPYTATAANKPTGTCITAGEMTTTNFTGGDIPLIFPCGEFNSKHQKVYIYMVNRSSTGTVNLYMKDTTAKSEATITASGTDTSAIAAGKTLTLISGEGNTYTLTSVVPSDATAGSKVSDLAYIYGDGDTMEETMIGIQETIEIIDNIAGRETKPFTASLDSNLVLRIKQNNIDAGTSNNTSIGGTFLAEGMITGADFVGGIDSYHLISRLGPKEFCFFALAGSPKLYADAEDSIVEVEYLTLEA